MISTQVRLLNAATATNSAPSAAPTTGQLLPGTDRGVLFLYSTAGSDTLTVTCKLWGYNLELAKWFPLGTHATAASKGLINDGNAIGETGTDTIAHAEELAGLKRFSHLYLEITAIGGTATAITAYVDCIRSTAGTH